MIVLLTQNTNQMQLLSHFVYFLSVPNVITVEATCKLCLDRIIIFLTHKPQGAGSTWQPSLVV